MRCEVTSALPRKRTIEVRCAHEAGHEGECLFEDRCSEVICFSEKIFRCQKEAAHDHGCLFEMADPTKVFGL